MNLQSEDKFPHLIYWTGIRRLTGFTLINLSGTDCVALAT